MLKNERGNSIVLVAASMVVLLGMAAFVIDLGMGFLVKSRLQATADAAALAGAQELPWDVDEAVHQAKNYVVMNGSKEELAEVEISLDRTMISVTLHKNVTYTFAQVLGFTEQLVRVKAQAINAPVTGMKGVRPLVVEDAPFIVGNQYVLKEGAGDSYSGNYGAIALGGTGASTYEENLLNGYEGFLRVGNLISTETGNMSSVTSRAVTDLISGCTHSPACTYLHYEKNCPRIIFIPVVDSLSLDGRKEATVVGFASFFLEGTQNSGGHTEIVGRFVREIASGEIEIGQGDKGLRGVRLVR